MRSIRSLQEIQSELERIVPAEISHYELLAAHYLSGGYSNDNFCVELDWHTEPNQTSQRKNYVLRLPRKDMRALACDRAQELHFWRTAADAQLLNRPVAFDINSGISLSPWIEGATSGESNGVTGHSEGLSARLSPQQLAVLCHRVHVLPCSDDARINTVQAALPTQRLRLFHRCAQRTHKRYPDLVQQALSWWLQQPAPENRQPVVCHMDLNPWNLLSVADQDQSCHVNGWQILDWEWATVADHRFDLANVILNHSLNEQQIREFLGCYSEFRGIAGPTDAELAYFSIYLILREYWWACAALALGNDRVEIHEQAKTNLTLLQLRFSRGLPPLPLP